MLRFLIFILIGGLPFLLGAQPFTKVEIAPLATDTTNTNGASWIDVDMDGDLDLFLSNANQPFGFNSLYKNLGGGRFERWQAGEVTGLQSATFGHAWGDYDNDGLPDLVIVNAYSRLGVMLYQNLGGGRFARNEGLDQFNQAVKGFNASWGDYDNDGFIDLVVTHPARFVGTPQTSNFLFRNLGDGSFMPVLNTPVTRVVAPFTNASWIDHDRDGDRDIFIGSGPANGTTAPDFIFTNQLKESKKPLFNRERSGIFAQDSLDGQVWNWIDYDNDGDLDAYVTNWGGASGGMVNHLYRQDKDSMVRVQEGAIVTDKDISLAQVWADFDNDGDLDCYVGNGSNQANRYYENQGDGSFKAETGGHFVTKADNSWGITVGDYDNDGDQDLFVSTKTGYIRGPGAPNHLYRNDNRYGNHWLTLTLRGSKSNRMALGARVYLTTTIGGKRYTQYREIGSNNTFLGQNDVRAHFGLGDAKAAELIRILWPSGQETRLRDIKADQFLTIGED